MHKSHYCSKRTAAKSPLRIANVIPPIKASRSGFGWWLRAPVIAIGMKAQQNENKDTTITALILYFVILYNFLAFLLWHYQEFDAKQF